MRILRVDRFLIVLAALLALAVLRRGEWPGEEALPGLMRAAAPRALLAQAAQGGAESEAERLRSELASARLEIGQLREQVERTRELAGFFEKLRWKRPPVAIPAYVCGLEPDAFRRSFRIDVGAAAGVTPGMAVVSGAALLGLVHSVSGTHTVVLRTDDIRFATEVEIRSGGTSARGIARGRARGQGGGIRVDFIPRQTPVERGQEVFTTAFGEEIPPGLVVGWVEDFEDVDDDGFLDISVRPAAEVRGVAQVEVLARR